MVVVPVAHLVAHHAPYLLDVQLPQEGLVDADEMLVADAVVLGPVVIEIVTPLYAYLIGGKVGLEG